MVNDRLLQLGATQFLPASFADDAVGQVFVTSYQRTGFCVFSWYLEVDINFIHTPSLYMIIWPCNLLNNVPTSAMHDLIYTTRW